MFSFFKRKKKQDVAETVVDDVQTPPLPQDGSDGAEAAAQQIFEPLTEAQLEAIEEHTENNALSQLVSDTLFTGGSGQYAAVAEAVRAARPHSEDCYVWIAAEAGLTAALRDIARNEWQLPAARCVAVPYWRMGEAEESYHNKRHEFIDNFGKP